MGLVLVVNCTSDCEPLNCAVDGWWKKAFISNVLKCTAVGDVEEGKGHPVTGHQGPRGVSRGIALLILNLGARRGWVVSTTPRPFYPLEKPSTHCTGSWVGPRAGLDVCEKSRPPP
jgi:hypothetical protein